MIDLYPGLLLIKRRSGRMAQVSGLDKHRVWLHWDDNGAQTIVKRKRFSEHAAEWEPVIYYQEEQATP